MKLIGLKILQELSREHADVRASLASWIAEVEEAEWQSTQDIKKRFIHASIISHERVVFNIKGNKYRVDTKINFFFRIVKIIRAGTHAEYDRWS